MSRKLRTILLHKGLYEAFLGNITDSSYSTYCEPHLQLLNAFRWRATPEGEKVWSEIYNLLLR